MYLQLVREAFTEDATEGKLYVNGTFECYTLEDTDRKLEGTDGSAKQYGKTAIPRGVYNMKLSMSYRFKQVMPELMNVPFFEGIRIHKGNYAGHETFLKIVPIDIDKQVLDTLEYVEVI